MSKNIKEERFRWISPIINKETTIASLLKVCPYSESSIKRWLRAFREGGIEALEPKSTRPKLSPMKHRLELKSIRSCIGSSKSRD